MNKATEKTTANYYKHNYDLNNLKIEIGNSFLENYTIEKMTLDYESNTHSQLNIVIKNNKENQNLYLALKNELRPEIKIVMIKDEIEKIFFTGQIENFSIGYHNSQGYEIKLIAFSTSKNLDRELKFRAYQNTKLTLKEIITNIMSTSPNIKVRLHNKLDTIQISKPIIQYNESDWDFIIRIASHAGFGVYPLPNGVICIGYNSGSNQEKDIYVKDHFWEIVKNEYGEIYYGLKSNNILLCGEEIIIYLNQNEKLYLHAFKGKIKLKDNQFESNVYMELESFNYEYISNKNIAGKVIEGTVESIFQENSIAKITVDLTEGLKKTVSFKLGFKSIPKISYSDIHGRFNFPYVTPYSQTNTGLFCTPEVNDRVAIYYPTEEESESYVMGAINNQGSGRFSDPTIRNFTITNSEEKLFHLYINNNYLNLENTETSIKTKDIINMISKNIISINSEKILELLSTENLILSSKEMKVNHKVKIETGDVINSKGASNNLEFSTISIKGNLKSS